MKKTAIAVIFGTLVTVIAAGKVSALVLDFCWLDKPLSSMTLSNDTKTLVRRCKNYLTHAYNKTEEVCATATQWGFVANDGRVRLGW